MMTTLAQRIAATLRADVAGMHAYAIQASTGLLKLDAMENPFSLPPALQQALGERLGRAAINRYPQASVVAACIIKS
jgi:histidinol-phosphate aminotransferase